MINIYDCFKSAVSTPRRYMRDVQNNNLVCTTETACDCCKNKIDTIAIGYPIHINRISCCMLLCKSCYFHYNKDFKYTILESMGEFTRMVFYISSIRTMNHIEWLPPKATYVNSKISNSLTQSGVRIYDNTKYANRNIELQNIQLESHNGMMIEQKTVSRIKRLDSITTTAEEDCRLILGEQ